jgi:hypothetical protein
LEKISLKALEKDYLEFLEEIQMIVMMKNRKLQKARLLAKN